MVRVLVVGALLAGFAAAPAHARTVSPYAKASLVRCDRTAREATFEGRMLSYRRAARMQLRFTLQARTADDARFRKVSAAGFGTWITVPAGLTKYTYDKTVQDLLAPAGYRVSIEFRWRDRRGKVSRSERVVSPACTLPDTRADLVVRSVRFEGDAYVATLFNRGRAAAGPFGVSFFADEAPIATAEVASLASRASVSVRLPAAPCAPGAEISAVADPRSEVDEADEENNAASALC
ncbi:MAG TPA: CARDB domain-containing protein [Solirubrobacter sp.]|nr:CARDB domain-containing protein [Solirubrobacter sp.]